MGNTQDNVQQDQLGHGGYHRHGDGYGGQVLQRQANDPTFDNVWEELKWRGLIHVSTDEQALAEALAPEAKPITFYCGFDPTAASLHLGNLVQILIMRRLQLAGNRPLALVGGSTGLIGDPRMSGERKLNSRDQVQEWVECLGRQLSRFLDFTGPAAARLVNNMDWTAPLSAIDFLREVGKHFRVNAMLKKDAVSARLNSEEGISYTEFSYQILQGLDFRQLYLDYDCVLQTGGSDQWGNLTSGVDLIRRTERVSVHALGSPLLTTADGAKFGKSEGNAIWLDGELTSPWAFYQFWLNTDDADVIKLLKVFTFLSRAQIEELETAVRDNPGGRAAQQRLAAEVTALVHGPAIVQQLAAAAQALFGGQGLENLDEGILCSALTELPNTQALLDTSIAQLLVDTGLCKSLGEGRRAIAQGGVYLNNIKVPDQAATLRSMFAGAAQADSPEVVPADPNAAAFTALAPTLPGQMAVLRRGRKTLAGVFYS